MPSRSKKVKPARIMILGVGGGGSNAVSRMNKDSMTGVELVCVNTDAQALDMMDVPTRLRIGDKTTEGLGSGGDPNVGRAAAEESQEEILKVVSDCNMVFVAVGMGGGTGTGAAPVVARLARDAGALTVGVVTKPFSFEGRPRMQIAEEGIRLLEEHVDTLITISNDRLLELCDIDVTVMDAFHMVDDVLAQGIQAISDVVNVPGEINVDFADVRNIMLNGGHALMAIGVGEGEDRVAIATNAALASPLLESSIQGATGILFNISGGRDLTLAETNRAAELINRASNPDAIVIFGVVHDPELDGQVRITLIATGLTTDEDVEVFGTQQRLRFPSRQLSAGGVAAAGGNLGGPAGGTDGYGWSSLFKRQADRIEEQPFS